MNDCDIKNLEDIPRTTISLLLEKGFQTSADLEELQPSELATELGVEKELALEILKSTTTEKRLDLKAQEIYDHLRDKFIITFCRKLDKMMGGGIPLSQMTEIAGPPGIGKTQLSIQIALDVQIPTAFSRLGGEAIFIDCEGGLFPERVASMAKAINTHLLKVATVSKAGNKADLVQIARETTVEKILDGISVFRATDRAHLMSIINHLPAILTKRPSIKVVIIDSIAFHFRRDSKEQPLKRHRILSGLAQSLNKLAFEKSCAIVVTNHMTTKIDRNSGVVEHAPALGGLWSYQLTNQIVLRWLEEDMNTRVAHLARSASQPPADAYYKIFEEGVRDVGYKASDSLSQVRKADCTSIQSNKRSRTDNDWQE